MGLFSNSNAKSSVMDIIRCDEQNYLVWKWRPQDTADQHRENAVRWGSSLRVKEGSVAIFVYSNDNGTVQDYIVGPADTIVDTKNLPVISSIVGLAYNGGSPFQAEVYFINLANTVQMKFAVPYFDVFDPELSEFSVPIAVRGSFDFNITDYKDFIKIHRLDAFSMNDLQAQVRDTVSECVKNIIANAPDTYSIPVIQIEKKIVDIKQAIAEVLSEKLHKDYGITLKDVNLAGVDIDKESEGYRELKAVTKDLTTATLKNRNKAKNIAESREIKGSQTLGMFERAANTFIDAKEKQFTRHKQAQSDYAEVIEDERAGKIGAIGGKLIRDIGKLVKNDNKAGEATLPPIPVSCYNVVLNGKVEGPFDIETLGKMSMSGQITSETLVWKKGMPDWAKAGSVDELKSLFDDMPPIPNA